MSKLNILYIHSHDTGRYIQPYGHAIPTPNLQRLAEQGVVFRQAFCANPTCSPSRASLLTGQWAHSNGMLGLSHRGFRLNDYGQHITHTLRNAGYTSALAGVQHVASKQFADPYKIGYDKLLNHDADGNNDKTRTAEAAVEFLRGVRQPFFLDVGFSETHRQFLEPGPAEDARYSRPPVPLPDTPETRYDMASYKASARVLDEKIGAVLKALEDNGLADNTLVISTTDHGIPFPGMKCSLTDHGIGVSLIMRGPGGFSGGKVIDAMVSQIDLFPTICDLIGIEKPDWLQGKSILPLARGYKDEINEQIFAEVNYHAAYEPQRCVRTKRWKYIRRYDDRQRAVLPNCDGGASKTLLTEQYEWQNQPRPREILFDLIFDPNEANNLAGDARAAAVLQEMSGRLDRWMEQTNDPILRGPIPLPQGGVTTHPDDYAPNKWNERAKLKTAEAAIGSK